MQQNPYIVLGIKEGATQAEAFDAYKALRERYERDRFLEGEAGAYAAKKLTELEDAYADIISELSKAYVVEDAAPQGYDDVRKAIADGDLDTAQKLLDDYTNRSAEWHYIQAKIYYDKGWKSEAKKQMEIALNMEPENQKYIRTMERIKKESSGNFGNFGGNERAGRSYTQTSNRTGGDMNSCCNCCSTMICVDCCCECFGGDCIPCC